MAAPPGKTRAPATRRLSIFAEAIVLRRGGRGRHSPQTPPGLGSGAGSVGARSLPRGGAEAAEPAPLTLDGARQLRSVPRCAGPALGLPWGTAPGHQPVSPACALARCSARLLHQKCASCPSGACRGRGAISRTPCFCSGTACTGRADPSSRNFNPGDT